MEIYFVHIFVPLNRVAWWLLLIQSLSKWQQQCWTNDKNETTLSFSANILAIWHTRTHSHSHTQITNRDVSNETKHSFHLNECKRIKTIEIILQSRTLNIEVCLCYVNANVFVHVETSANEIVYKITVCSRKPNKLKFVDRVTRSQSIWTLFRAAPM